MLDEYTSEIIRRVLAETPPRVIKDPNLIPSAVMVLFYQKDDQHCILLNKRTDTVEHHKGEISFPGGRKDDEDLSLLDTALRETEEEMGILTKDINVLGQIDDMPTNSNYLISAFVGTIRYPYAFKPSDIEVAEIIEAPLSILTDPEYFNLQVRMVGGQSLECPEFNYLGHRIWGATGRVLYNFIKLLNNVSDEEAHWRKNQFNH
jgi:8-oxo-dGTP pyrophosphatase MutT (NUDIX family)